MKRWKLGIFPVVCLVVLAVFTMGADYSWNSDNKATLGKEGRGWSWAYIANGFVLEGATQDAYEITASVADPTADIEWVMPTHTGLYYQITNKATNYTVLSTDAGAIITNNGSSGALTFTLPEASTVIGRPFIFTIDIATSVSIDVASADQILPTTNTAGDRVWADAIGETITLVAIDNTDFIELSKIGTWTDGD